MTLGDIIKEYRKSHNLSMDAFSEKSGISKAYISLLEKNKHPKTGKTIAPSIQSIKQAADGMGLDFNELFSMIDGNVSLNESLFENEPFTETLTAQVVKDRLREIRENTNMNKKEFSNYIGIKYTTYNGYETGNREPNLDFLVLISNKFGVSTDYILGLTKEKQLQLSYTLKTEDDIINLYSDLDDIGKNHLNTVLSWELERMKGMNSPKSTPIIPMPTRIVNYYQRLASAGTGQILWDDIPANEIEIPDNKETKNVDFALGVNGDSMEPVYWDSDIVLVEKTTDLEIGEIGVFEVDGECFIKELGDHELISFNRQYAPKPIYDTTQFYCIGRVVGNLMEHSSSDIAYLIRRRGALKRYQSMYPMAAEKGIDDSVESQEMVKRMIEEANTLRE